MSSSILSAQKKDRSHSGVYTVMMRLNESEASRHALSQPAIVENIHALDDGAAVVGYYPLDEDYRKIETASIAILVKDGSFKFGHAGNRPPRYSLTYPRRKVLVSAKEGYFVQSSDPIDAGYKNLLSSIDINDRQLIRV